MQRICYTIGAVLLCVIGCSKERVDYDKKHQLSVAHNTQVLARAPQDSTALISRAQAYYDLGKFDEALNDCNRFLELYPSVGTAYNLRGCIFYRVGGDSNVAAAMADWRKVLAFDRSHSIAYSNIGLIFSDKENWDSALAYYNISLELQPSDTLVLLYRASAFRHLGRYEEAADDLNKALQINPRFADGLWLHGNICYDQEDYVRCVQEYRQYLDVVGNKADPEVYYSLGCALEQLDQGSKAKEQFEKVLQKDSTHAYAMVHLAGIYEDRGDVTEAIRYYNAYLRVADQTDTAWTNYAKERLAALAKE